MTSHTEKDAEYLAYLVNAIRVCANYRPKLGHGAKMGYNLREFQEMYQSDPFYNWIGLDNPLMYAAHKAAGGMTSIYRQIGIGCENLFRKVLQDSLSLPEEEVKWSYTVKKGRDKTRTLSLDARITTESVRDAKAKRRIRSWIAKSAEALEVKPAYSLITSGHCL